MDIVGELISVFVENVFNACKEDLQWRMGKDELGNLAFHSRGRNNTGLHIAARIGNKKMVEKLLTQGQDMLASLNSEHETPLHIAARSGHSQVVEVLIDGMPSISISDVETGGIGAGQQTLRMRNMKGNTPLHEAARNGHYSAVVVLVEKLKTTGSADLLVSLNDAGESPLSMAVDAKASQIVETILNSASDSLLHTSSDGQTLLHRAILRADLRTMKIILEKSPALKNEQDSYGRSPLHYAAASGAFAMVDELLQRKPSYESFLDHNLATPAHMAAANGHLNVLPLFVKYGLFSVESLNNHHQNILHVAAQNGHYGVVQYIIKDMFMVSDLLNETDEDGNTPLHLAAAKLQSRVISTLIQSGNVDTRIINGNRETALDIARNVQLVSPSVNDGNEGTNSNQTQATPNRTGCAYEEKREAEKQRTIEILMAARAKQAEKLEGILEQQEEDPMIQTIRDKKSKEMAGTLIVMATLVATVTFTAAFTLPGGLHSEGENQGMAVLVRKAAFQAFIVTDTIAMTTSMTAAVILFTSSWSWNDEKNKRELHFVALQMLWLSLTTMGIAFVTGLLTVLSHSMELAIVVCCIGCFFPGIVYLFGPLILPEESIWSLKKPIRTLIDLFNA